MNTMTDIVNNVGSWAIAEAWNIMGGPVGYIIAFVIWISLIGLALLVFKKFVH